jgi:hypothetical protein
LLFTVRELIAGQPETVTARSHDPVAAALQTMIEHDFSQLPGVDGDQEPRFMVSSGSIPLRRAHRCRRGPKRAPIRSNTEVVLSTYGGRTSFGHQLRNANSFGHWIDRPPRFSPPPASLRPETPAVERA